MLAGCLLFLGMLWGAEPLKTVRVDHTLVLTDVYLNGAGPYQMLIDTGNASSIVRPSVAKRIGLRPSFQVEQVTAAGSRMVGAAKLDSIQTGEVISSGVEVMITEPMLKGVDGVLGQSWLSQHDYLLDYRAKRVELDGPAPDGIELPLSLIDGRPAIQTRVDGHDRELVLDSGAPCLVLFERTAIRGSVMLFTHAGSAQAESSSALLHLGEKSRRVRAVRVDSSETGGLLGSSSFRAVYISNKKGVLVIVP